MCAYTHNLYIHMCIYIYLCIYRIYIYTHTHIYIFWLFLLCANTGVFLCVIRLHRSCSSSPLSCRWARARCGPAQRCWCTRPRPCAASWWPRTWIGSPPRCTGHTCKVSACQRSRRSDIPLPASGKQRVRPVVSAWVRRGGGQMHHTWCEGVNAIEGMIRWLCKLLFCCLYMIWPNITRINPD